MASNDVTRRTFVKGSAAALVGVPAVAGLGWHRHAETIRVGVIGCGGRGTGAAVNCLEADPSTRLVAMADLFSDRLDSSRRNLANQEGFDGRNIVDPDRCHSGFDAYQRVVGDDEVDLVILATPPHFRPIHFEAAVNAGKHVFMEKPVAVDPVGVRRVLAAADVADTKGLRVETGTQRRNEQCYTRLMDRVHGGEIGEIVSARCYWNQGGLWVHDRKPEYSDMEWQVRNWLYFAWLSGDHICEQHIHNLDVINWAIGGPPASCVGMGGRQVRTGSQYGNVFDHFAIEYEYPGGAHLLSTCRQIDGCDGKVEEILHGTTGRTYSRSGFARIDGGWEQRGGNNPYVEEHVTLINAIRDRLPLNNARVTAQSTLTAIMGRMSAYTGKRVTWEQAMGSDLDLSPSVYEFTELPVRPVPVPGRTPLI